MENIKIDEVQIFRELQENELNDIATFFEKNNYVLVKNILTNEIKNYLNNKITFNDNDSNALNDVRQFYREHNDTSCSETIHNFLNIVKPAYCLMLNKKLTNLIGFCMKYNENSDCLPHYDNYNMPISSTICFKNEDSISYPLYIDKTYFNNPHPFRLTIHDKDGIPKENIIKIDINEGDIGIFRGRNHLHWRDKKYVKDYRGILVHTEDYSYNGNTISYLHNEHNFANINNVKNIGTYELTDVNNYD
jgi:hypothetical protein